MSEQEFVCPSCQAPIKLTESLAAPLIEATRKKYEKQLADKDTAIAAKEAAVNRQQEEIAAAKLAIDEQVTERLGAERKKIEREEAQKAKQLYGGNLDEKTKELTALQEVLKQRDEKLAEAQRAQAEIVLKEVALEDAKREMELTIAKGIQAGSDTVREKAKQEAEERLGLKVSEKDEQIAAMNRQIDDLKRRAEQGSQQIQGEVQEQALDALLREKFPHDTIERVGKGEFGGDVIHQVCGPTGQLCGTILWESKRTKAWSDGWLQKLRDDQRAAKADLALLISNTLPKNLRAFDLVDGIWIADFASAVPVAIALRQQLIALAALRQAKDGQGTKMELVYEYLIGPRFRHRVEAIVEKFSTMQEDLDKERKFTMKMWAKREMQISGVIDSTAGMYGDLQGIAGKSFREIEGLEYASIAPPNAQSEDTM